MSDLRPVYPDSIQRLEHGGRICTLVETRAHYFRVVHTKLGTVSAITDRCVPYETHLDFAARGKVHLRTYRGHMPTTDELAAWALQFTQDVVNLYNPDGTTSRRRDH